MTDSSVRYDGWTVAYTGGQQAGTERAGATLNSVVESVECVSKSPCKRAHEAIDGRKRRVLFLLPRSHPPQYLLAQRTSLSIPAMRMVRWLPHWLPKFRIPSCLDCNYSRATYSGTRHEPNRDANLSLGLAVANVAFLLGQLTDPWPHPGSPVGLRHAECGC